MIIPRPGFGDIQIEQELILPTCRIESARCVVSRLPQIGWRYPMRTADLTGVSPPALVGFATLLVPSYRNSSYPGTLP